MAKSKLEKLYDELEKIKEAVRKSECKRQGGCLICDHYHDNKGCMYLR